MPAAIPTTATLPEEQEGQGQEATQQRVEQTVASVEHIQFNMFNQYFNLYSTFIRSFPYEPTPTLLVQLAKHNNRSIAAPGGKELQATAIVNSSSDLTTSSHGVQEGPGSDGIRGAENVGQGSGKGSQLLSQPLPQQNISGSQEG